jgi:hypothetical protein
MNLAILASLLTLVALVWMALRAQRMEPKHTEIPPAMVPAMAAELGSQPVQPPRSQPSQAQPVQTSASSAPSAIIPPVATLPATVVTQIDANGAMKHVAQRGETAASPARDLLAKDSKTNRDASMNANVLKYTAVPGDTVGKMAAAFLGSDDQAHQNAVINANPSLQADADHVQVGQVYRIPAPDGLSATVGTSPARPTARPPHQTDADEVVAAGAARTLKYTARDGDTLGKIALQLLGSDTPENRERILSKNADLRKSPDHVVSGQSYWIPAPEASADVP